MVRLCTSRPTHFFVVMVSSNLPAPPDHVSPESRLYLRSLSLAPVAGSREDEKGFLNQLLCPLLAASRALSPTSAEEDDRSASRPAARRADMDLDLLLSRVMRKRLLPLS